MKLVARFTFDLSVIGILVYLIFYAVQSGEVMIRTLRISQADQPVLFIAGVSLLGLLAIAWLGLMLSRTFSGLDQRMKAFGGTYNFKTFKAATKDALQSQKRKRKT
jgi:hypothetical protein